MGCEREAGSRAGLVCCAMFMAGILDCIREGGGALARGNAVLWLMVGMEGGAAVGMGAGAVGAVGAGKADMIVRGAAAGG